MARSQPQHQPAAPWSRLAGIGFEFGASLAVFMLLGYWVDRHWGIQKHWGLLAGTLLGLVGGSYNFIRETRRALRQTRQQTSRPSDPATGTRSGPDSQEQC